MECDPSSSKATAEDKHYLQLAIAKLEILATRISAKDWDIAGIADAKCHPGKIGREYLNALKRAHPSVFCRRYPDLYEDDGVDPPLDTL